MEFLALEHRQTSAYCACSRCETFLFARSLVMNTGNRQSSICCKPYHFLPFPFVTQKSPARFSDHTFPPFPIQPRPLFPLIVVGTKMPSPETFKFNITINPIKRYVDRNAFYGFRSIAKRDLILGHIRV